MKNLIKKTLNKIESKRGSDKSVDIVALNIKDFFWKIYYIFFSKENYIRAQWAWSGFGTSVAVCSSNSPLYAHWRYSGLCSPGFLARHQRSFGNSTIEYCCDHEEDAEQRRSHMWRKSGPYLHVCSFEHEYAHVPIPIRSPIWKRCSSCLGTVVSRAFAMPCCRASSYFNSFIWIWTQYRFHEDDYRSSWQKKFCFS